MTTPTVLRRYAFFTLLFLPWALIFTGAALNITAMGINHGQMPVLVPGGVCDPADFEGDRVHSCMTASTHWKFICDWIDLKSTGIASPGDLCVWAYEAISFPCLFAWIVLVLTSEDGEYGLSYTRTGRGRGQVTVGKVVQVPAARKKPRRYTNCS